MYCDSFSNLIANINLGYKILLPSIIVYNTTLTQRVLSLLLKLGYIYSFVVLNSKQVQIFLKYNEYNSPALRSIQRISKPGNRIFLSYKNLKNFTKNSNLNNNYQVGVFSTSKGILTGFEALELKVGGELLFLVN